MRASVWRSSFSLILAGGSGVGPLGPAGRVKDYLLRWFVASPALLEACLVPPPFLQLSIGRRRALAAAFRLEVGWGDLGMSNCWTFPLKEVQLLTPAALFSGLRCHGDKNGSSSRLISVDFEEANDFFIAFFLFVSFMK